MKASAIEQPKTRAKQKTKPASAGWSQLALFGDDSIDVVNMIDQLDTAEGEVLVAIEADPTILAGASGEAAVGIKDALTLARFMKSAGNPEGVVREALEVSNAGSSVVLAQMAKVEAIVDEAPIDLDTDDEFEEIVDGEHDLGDDVVLNADPEGADGERQERKFDHASEASSSALALLMKRVRLDRYAPLTAEEEAALAVKIQAGDIEARNELAQHNIRYLISHARRFLYTGRSLEWLVAAGQVGLITAAQKFDPARGRFVACAQQWIRQSIQRELGGDNLMKTPAYMQPKANRLRREAAVATSDIDRAKLITQAESLEREIKARRSTQVSMDASIGGDSDSDSGSMHNYLEAECEGPEEEMEKRRLVSQLMKFAGELPDARLKDIFLMRIGLHPEHFGDPRTLQDVGQHFDVSRERIRQLYVDAAEKVVQKVVNWAKGEDNLPEGFRKGIMNPGRG
ncbi:sigma-70 family RNA polymerase sigma factor [Paucibacter soli]|uniref:sigma-70 family RNA polymerase sigma factor n=1 Tax=Paucibacter soli TaxID=3133433 RepID=UPI0030975BB4